MFFSDIKCMLHRPLVDLQASEDAEFFANAAAVAAEALADGAPPAPLWVQRRGMPGLRERVLAEARPLREVQAPRWHAVQAMADRWHQLAAGDKIKLARVLLQVGHYQQIERLLREDRHVEDDVRLALLAVTVQVGLERAGQPPEGFDARALLALCERAAATGRPVVKEVAAIKAFLIALQYLHDDALTERAYRRLLAHEAALARAGATFAGTLLRSCILRASAMWPHRRGDAARMAEEMAAAEAAALALPDGSPLERFLREENLFSLHESRTKERLAAGDLAGALHHAETLVAMFPFTSTARIELGEVLLRAGRAAEAATQYALAADHGPPGSAIAWFMAGEAHAAAGAPEAARAAWLAAQRVDPLAVCSIRQLAARPAARSLDRWCRQWLQGSAGASVQEVQHAPA